MNEAQTEKRAAEEMRDELRQSNYKAAYQILRRHPLAQLTMDDGKELLNHLDAIDADASPEELSQRKLDTSNFIYKRLQRQHILRGFGCVDKGAYPENITDISPLRLEEITGLSIASLTPKQRTTYWRLAGIGLCLFEYALGTSIGIDPVYTLIPGTFLLFGLDQLLYKGAYFETAYQTLFPEYKQKVICHEAGHFLLAYLLGLPISACVTSAWEAKKYPEIRGQAGTVFSDLKLVEEMKNSKVSRGSLDRLSVVLMAGIAAEACKFGNAEGGAQDEQELFALLTQVQPPWNLIRIQGQARWAAVQALLLIREHQESYNALYKALCENKPVGDCVLAIEQHLPKHLPSLQRSEEKKKSDRNAERAGLLKFVQRLTYKVGGIDPTPAYSTSTSSATTEQAFPRSSIIPASSSPSPTTDGFNINRDGYLVNPVPKAIDAPSTATATAVSIVPVVVPSASTASPADATDALTQIAETIKLLEEATVNGYINITEQESNAGGGIWLNGLKSYGDTSLTPGATTPSTVQQSIDNNMDDFLFPKPVEGYEERIKQLRTQSQSLVAEGSAAVGGGDKVSKEGSKALLTAHAGYQWKRLDNQRAYNLHQV